MPLWSPEQLSNARVIMQVGRQLGASDRDILIGLMAAWQESNLRNLNYGDRDSIGLFQQRNAWAPGGSREYRLNPRNAARMFFTGGHQGQRGLLDFQNRASYGLGQAAQKVQVSAFPDRYDKWEDESKAMMAELGSNLPQLPGQPEQPGSPDQKPTPEITLPEEPEQPGTPLAAAGLESPAPDGLAASGAEAAGAPGVESADVAPDFVNVPDLDETMFLPPSTGEAGGVAGSFEETFSNTGPVGGSRSRIVDIAKSYLGIPYKFGGNDPNTGLDCSSFTKLVYKQLGIDLPRVSFQQARSGPRIGLGELQVGDMVAWDNSSRNNGADHIAIYIGNGQIIEEPRPGLSVRIRSLRKDEGDAWGVRMDI